MAHHLRSLLDLTPAQCRALLQLAADIKTSPGAYTSRLAGKSVAMIFSKPSTRTRVSFEVGIYQLGGQALSLSAQGGAGMQMGRGETVHDTAKVLSRFVDAIVIRTFAQEEVEGLAEHGSVPVVNALTDMYHPCQALADMQTIIEKLGDTAGKKLVYVGAGNNVAHSLMLAASRGGMYVTVACPATQLPNANVVRQAQDEARKEGVEVAVTQDVRAAVEGADVIYTDTWISMGEEAEAARLRKELAAYQVDADLMRATGRSSTIFMHCLPAHRGEEVTDEVMDGKQSVVFDQAENRLHAQKALLCTLLAQ